MNTRTKILLTVKLGFSAVLLYLVLSKISPEAIIEQLRNADPVLAAIAIVLGTGSIALAALRWQALAPEMLTYPRALRYTWIGLFFAHVLPGAISGDIAKGVSLALNDRQTRTSILPLSIIADKAIGLLVLLLFFDAACALLYLFYEHKFDYIRQLAIYALVGSVVGTAAAAVALGTLAHIRTRFDADSESRFRQLLGQLVDFTLYYADHPRPALQAVAISVFIHLLNIMTFFLILRALQVDAGLLFAAIVYPVLSIVLLVPLSISGIGVRDVAMVVLFQMFGLSGTAAVASAWLGLLLALPNVLIGASLQVAEMYRK